MNTFSLYRLVMSRLTLTSIVASTLLGVCSLGFAQHPRDCLPYTECRMTACEPCQQVCEPCEPVCDVSCFKPKASKIKTYGWIAAGITGNSNGSGNRYVDQSDNDNPFGRRKLTALSGNSYLLGTQQPADFKVNQLWLGMVKPLDTRHGFDWGFQVDAVYGTDGVYAQSFGNRTFDYDWGREDYDFAIAQLCGEVGYKKWKLRVGKFGSLMVHEQFPAAMNFFNSHPYSCYSTPLHFSGAMLDYEANKQLTLSGGWTTGSNGGFENRFGDNGFFGKATFRPTNALSITYNVYVGQSIGGRYREYRRQDDFTQSVVVSYKISSRMTYNADWHWSDNKRYEPDARSRAYGVNQDLIYAVNQKWSVGMRFEWLYNRGGLFDSPDISGGEGTDIFALTYAVNWSPTKWFTLKPEIRYDWSTYANGFKPFANGTSAEQLSAGCTAIFKF